MVKVSPQRKRGLRNMSRFGVFLSCVNQNCKSDEYITVISAIDLESALRNAKEYNQRQNRKCGLCGETMVFKPFENNEKISTRKNL